MTPRFPRTRKFANPYALAAVDFVWTIFWISAFASQASYNTSGKCKGACSASKAVVGLGVFIWYATDASIRHPTKGIPHGMADFEATGSSG